MNNKSEVARFLATSMALAAAVGGPYSDFGVRIPRGKTQSGTLVGCHVCGTTRETLYKDGDQRICGECRKKKEGELNGQNE